MNRQEVIRQLIDLHYNFRNYCEVEATEEDVQALEYAINELERTAQEVPVQEQSSDGIKKVAKEIAKAVINEITKQQKRDDITILPV